MHIIPLVLFVFILAACTSLLGPETPPFQKNAVLQGTLLHTRYGLAILFQHGERSLLYGSGGDSAGFADSLLQHGVRDIETVLIAHWNEEYSNGLLSLLLHAEEGKLHIRRVLYGSDQGNPILREKILSRCARQGIATQRLFRGDTLQSLSPFSIRVLWPDSGASRDKLSATLVLRLTDTRHIWLLTGDLKSDQEAELLRLEPNLRAGVLQAGHHGSDSASSWKFLTALQPDFALIGADQRSHVSLPGKETLARLYRILPDSTHLFRSDQHSPVTFEWIYGTGIWPAVFRVREAEDPQGSRRDGSASGLRSHPDPAGGTPGNRSLFLD